MGSKWYVVRSKPRQERRARQEMLNQGFTVYLPYGHRWIDEGKQYRLQSWCLLPRYLFVQFDFEDRRGADWVKIKSTRGVERILQKPSGDPDPLRCDSVIDRIAAYEWGSRQQEKRPKKGRTDLEPGDVVRIERHDFWEGYNGLLLSSAHGKATVLLGALSVTLPDVDLSLTEKGGPD